MTRGKCKAISEGKPAGNQIKMSLWYMQVGKHG